MARQGGFGRTGYFAANMELNKYYSIHDVYKFFEEHKQPLNMIQCKAVLDSMRKRKSYAVKWRQGKFEVKLLMRIEEYQLQKSEDQINEELNKYGNPSSDCYINIFLHGELSEMSNTLTVVLKNRDPNVGVLFNAKANLKPVIIDEEKYLYMGHNPVGGGKVSLLMQKLSKEQLKEFTNPPIYYQLS